MALPDQHEDLLKRLTDYDHCSGYDGSDWEDVSREAASVIRSYAARVDPDRLRSIIHSATHEVLPLADDVTGLGIKARAAMQVEIADRIIAALTPEQEPGHV